MNIATYLSTEYNHHEGTGRTWFGIQSDENPEYEKEYAITSDGKLLDCDGCPLNPDDFEGIYVIGLIRKYYTLENK